MSKKTPKYQRNREDLTDFFTIKNLQLTKKQQEFLKLIHNNKITIATGPAGTSKTFGSCYASLQLLKENKIKKIILSKPTVITAGSTDLGALPGELEDKISVYAESFYHNFSNIVEEKDLKYLVELKIIEFKPVQYMRGCTFNNSIVLIDEIQNFHINELMTLITRMGTNTKIVLTGDVRQNDIKNCYVAIDALKKILKGIDNVALFEFTRQDIMRDSILIKIIDRYEKAIENKELPENRF